MKGPDPCERPKQQMNEAWEALRTAYRYGLGRAATAKRQERVKVAVRAILACREEHPKEGV